VEGIIMDHETLSKTRKMAKQQEEKKELAQKERRTKKMQACPIQFCYTTEQVSKDYFN